MLTLLLLTVSGCTLGEPSGFTNRVDRRCAKAGAQIGRLDTATSGVAALTYATQRYAIMERVVSEVTTDVGLPGGDRGAQLRAKWLRPARASLAQGLHDLDRLRVAVNHHDDAAQATALAAALRAGQAGVDTTFLADQHLPRCATTFGAPPPAS